MVDNIAPKGLKVLFTIIPHGKKEVFMDLIESFDSNAQMCFYSKGTASNDLLNLLGLLNSQRDVIVSILREDKVGDCILAIEDKLNSFKHEKGISFAIPFESLIGNTNYLMLANL